MWGGGAQEAGIPRHPDLSRRGHRDSNPDPQAWEVAPLPSAMVVLSEAWRSSRTLSWEEASKETADGCGKLEWPVPREDR